MTPLPHRCFRWLKHKFRAALSALTASHVHCRTVTWRKRCADCKTFFITNQTAAKTVNKNCKISSFSCRFRQPFYQQINKLTNISVSLRILPAFFASKRLFKITAKVVAFNILCKVESLLPHTTNRKYTYTIDSLIQWAWMTVNVIRLLQFD